MQKYIGITDFSKQEQVLEIKALFAQFSKVVEHTLMVGIMMSHKTLHNLPSKWTNAWPLKKDIPEIFGISEGVMNTLHYADYGLQSIVSDHLRAISYCGPNLHAIQFDVPWPYAMGVKGLKEIHPHLDIILQVSQTALDALSSPTPNDVVVELKKYGTAVDCVLFDMSAGKGKEMNSSGLIPLIDSVKEKLPNIEIAVAGGLGPKTTHLLEPLLEKYGPTFSIDAQGQLRASHNALDPINWNFAKEYVQKSLKLFYP